MCSAGRYGNINSKCGFFTLNEFVHESRRGFTASTNSNTVQPQEWRKHVLSVRVKTVVRGFDQMIQSSPSLRFSIGVTLLHLCTSMNITIRLKPLHANTGCLKSNYLF